MLNAVGVSCHILYSVVSYLLLITSVGEEKANCSAIVYFKLCVFCLEGSPLPLGA